MVRIRIPGSVGGVIKGAGVLDDIANLIANPPDTPVGGAVGRAGQKFCDALSAAPALAFGILQSQGVIGSIVCEPYFNNGGPSAPEPGPPPYTGGNCPGVFYQGFGQVFQNNVLQENPSSTPNNRLLGPLTFNGVVDDGINISYPVIDANGAVSRLTMGGAEFRPSTDGWEVRNINFAITVGTECEDPNPPALPQPGPNPAPFPPDYTPGVDFGLDDDGEPFFDVPGIENPFGGPIPFEDPFSTPETPNTPQPAGDNTPGESDSVGDSVAEVTGGEDGAEIDFGEPPLGKIWVGCLVEFSAGTNYGGIPGTSPENTVYPTVIGNVSLRFATGRGESKPARSRWTEAIRPSTALVVEGAFVQARLGVTASVYPISVTVCKEVSCPLE